jgi:hypothetical protein
MHGGLWNGTRGAAYVFPSAIPTIARGEGTPQGTGARIELTPPPFGATFAELRNLNPNLAGDHLYPWIRDLLTPGMGLGPSATRTAPRSWLSLFQTSASSPLAGAAIGVTRWGAPFEEIDP